MLLNVSRHISLRSNTCSRVLNKKKLWVKLNLNATTFSLIFHPPLDTEPYILHHRWAPKTSHCPARKPDLSDNTKSSGVRCRHFLLIHELLTPPRRGYQRVKSLHMVYLHEDKINNNNNNIIVRKKTTTITTNLSLTSKLSCNTSAFSSATSLNFVFKSIGTFSTRWSKLMAPNAAIAAAANLEEK